MKIIITLALSFCGVVNMCLGQSFQGKIIDSDSSEIISSVNVMFQKNNRGTISNENGQFKILVTEDDLSDTIVFSHIGYADTKIAVADLNSNINAVKLKYLGYNIPVSSKNSNYAEKLIKKALKQITSNYPQENHWIRSFYSEEIKHQDGRIFDYAEGIVEILKEKYKNNPSEYSTFNSSYDEGMRIIHGFYEAFYTYLVLESEHFYSEPGIMQGGEIPLIIDLLKSDASFLLKDNIRRYNWKLTGMTNVGDRPAKVIAFQPKNEYARYQGEIILDDESNAIVASKFYITGMTLSQMNQTDYWVDLISREYQIDYKRTTEGYIIGRKKVISKFKQKFTNETFTYTLNFVTTDVEFDSKDEITQDKIFNNRKKLPMYMGPVHDSWEKTDVIKRSKKVQQALAKVIVDRANKIGSTLLYAKLDSNILLVDYGHIIPEKVENAAEILADLEATSKDWRQVRGILLTLIMEAEGAEELMRLGEILLAYRKTAIHYEWLDLRALLLFKQGKEDKAFIEQQAILKDATEHGILYRTSLQRLRSKL